LGHSDAVVLDQHLHRAPQCLRLLAIEAGGEDVALELLDRHREIVLRRSVLLEELLGDAVDVDVGRLRGEHHRDEELEWILEAKSDLRVCMRERETLDDRSDARALRAYALARFVDVAARHETTLTDCR